MTSIRPIAPPSEQNPEVSGLHERAQPRKSSERGVAYASGKGRQYAVGIGGSVARAAHGFHKKRRTFVKLFDRVFNPREIRRRLGLNQEQFWTQIGVTQSGGSRYESGREMPKPVRELLRLVHVEQIDLSQVKRVDFEIISYLKESHPDLYRSLRRAVRSQHRTGTGAEGGAPDEMHGEDTESADPASPVRADEPIATNTHSE
jgi:transcriptional regulator with XRE-family HTH domain